MKRCASPCKLSGTDIREVCPAALISRSAFNAFKRAGERRALHSDVRKLRGIEHRAAQHIAACPRFGVFRNLARKIAALFLPRLRIINHETVRPHAQRK